STAIGGTCAPTRCTTRYSTRPARSATSCSTAACRSRAFIARLDTPKATIRRHARRMDSRLQAEDDDSGRSNLAGKRLLMLLVRSRKKGRNPEGLRPGDHPHHEG